MSQEAYVDDKESKKEKILKAAVEIFSCKLFHQVTMDEIAVSSGVGKGTLYQYFNSKEDLFHEVIKYAYKTYYQVLKNCLSVDGSSRQKLEAVMSMQQEFMKSHMKFVYLLAEERLVTSLILEEEAIEAHQEIIELVRKVIEDGIKKGEFRKIDPTLAAKIFMSGIAALWYNAYVYGETQGLLNYSMEEIMDIFYNGFNADQRS